MSSAKVKATLPLPVGIVAQEPKAVLRKEKRKPCSKITLNEGFLSQFKILKPIDGIIPDTKEFLANAPKSRIVVGISGVSCGGKTTVANAVSKWLGSYGTIIHQDDYYLPPEMLPINEYNFPEFDEPEAIEMDNLCQDIKKWQESKSENGETEVLIVEGTMIFTNREVCKLCDLRYIIHADINTVQFRRSQRNYKIADPPGIIPNYIWPKYIKHRSWFCDIAEDEKLICKQIDGTVNVQMIVAGIMQDVKINKHR